MDTDFTQTLTVPATDLLIPDEPTQDQLEALLRDAASDSVWSMPVYDLAYAHVLRLAIASVLETQVLHIRSQRFDTFALAGDPAAVTLEQVAALFRPHNGTAGQAFELAVADAINAGVAEVLDPVRQALQLLNVPSEGRIRMLCLGLEKVPSEARAEFWAEVGSLIDDDTVLRTGQRGRPAKLATVIGRLCQSTWSEMGGFDRNAGYTGDERAQVSQLGRADALLYGEGWMTPVSLKINERHIISPWLDVPLWITTSTMHATKVYKRESHGINRPPQIVVTLSTDGWAGLFANAVDAVLIASRGIDRGQSPGRLRAPTGTPTERGMFRAAVQRLWQRRGDTVAAICNSLRDIDPAVVELFGQSVESSPTVATARLLDTAVAEELWTPSGSGAQLVVGQAHLFVPAPGGGYVARPV